MFFPTTLRTALRSTAARRSALSPSLRRSFGMDNEPSWLEKNQGPLYIVAAIASLGSIYVLQPADSWIKIGNPGGAPRAASPNTTTAGATPPAGSAQDVMGGSGKQTPPPPGAK